MEITITDLFKTEIDKIADIKYIGYYPYDIQKITMNMPCVLIKMGDTIISAMGHRRYQYTYTTQIILYSNQSFTNIQTMQQNIITAVYTVLTDTSNAVCLDHLDQFNIEAGDIGQYIQASSTGYNANIVVRKLILNYTITKTI